MNVPALASLLSRYDPGREFYLGKTSVGEPLEVVDRSDFARARTVSNVSEGWFNHCCTLVKEHNFISEESHVLVRNRRRWRLPQPPPGATPGALGRWRCIRGCRRRHQTPRRRHPGLPSRAPVKVAAYRSQAVPLTPGTPQTNTQESAT